MHAGFHDESLYFDLGKKLCLSIAPSEAFLMSRFFFLEAYLAIHMALWSKGLAF